MFLDQSVETMSVPVFARSKAWVCGRSAAAIVGSNPAGVMDVCRDCCVLSVLLSRADHPSRGVLTTVVCHCACSRNLVNEEVLAHGGGGDAPNKKNRKSYVRFEGLSETTIRTVLFRR
jgi:hypothetical protein